MHFNKTEGFVFKRLLLKTFNRGETKPYLLYQIDSDMK